MSSKVYFSRDISAENVIRMYEAVGFELPGKIAVKLHSGEKGNQNFLRPEFWKPMIERVDGRVVESNAAYSGERNSTEKHRKLIEYHGWSRYFDVDILDEDGPDLEFDIPNGKILKKNYVGKHIANYDSMLVLAHFKGHPAGGYGGALKQLAIGCASADGKCLIHSAGYTKGRDVFAKYRASNDDFCQSMAEAASSITDYFKGNMVFINVMKNLSVDCDCCAIAEDPCMEDIGILSSLDPVALDKACMDLIYASNDPGKNHFIERVESKNGCHTIEVANEMGIGTIDYDLIQI